MDTIKGVSILLVVFCHYVLLSKETVVGNIIMCVAWGGVPCFMMVSGALMHRSRSFSWSKYFRKLVKIYVVLVVWRGIYLIFSLAMGAEITSKRELFQYLFFCQDVSYVNTGAMWYMIAFLVVLLIYPVTWYLFRQGGKQGKQLVLFLIAITFSSSILISAVGFVMDVLGKALGLSVPDFTFLSKFFPLSHYGEMIFYFLLGAFLYEEQEKIIQVFSRYKWLPITCVFAGTAGLMVIKFVQCGTFAWNHTYLNSGYTRLSTVVLSIGIFVLAMQVGEHRVAGFLSKYVGRYTMGVYYLHCLPLIVCNQYIYPYIVQRSVGANLIKTALVTLVCVGITVGMRKIPYVRTLVQ